jgi:hypothetical protein
MESGEKPFKIAPFLLESKLSKTNDDNTYKRKKVKNINTLLELIQIRPDPCMLYTHIPSKKEERFKQAHKTAIKLTLICSLLLVLLSTYLMPTDALFVEKCTLFLFISAATPLGLCLLISIIFNRIDNLMFSKERKDKFDKYMEKVREINEKIQKRDLIIDG